MKAEDYYRPLQPEQAQRTSVGHAVEAFAAVRLRYLGFHVLLGPCRLRSENESPELFATETDLLIGLSPTGPWRNVEVKGKAVDFTDDPASWPFKDVVLYRSGKGVRPDAVVFVSTKTWCSLGVVANGNSYLSETSDPRQGYKYQTRSVAKTELLDLDRFTAEMAGRLGKPL